MCIRDSFKTRQARRSETPNRRRTRSMQLRRRAGLRSFPSRLRPERVYPMWDRTQLCEGIRSPSVFASTLWVDPSPCRRAACASDNTFVPSSEFSEQRQSEADTAGLSLDNLGRVSLWIRRGFGSSGLCRFVAILDPSSPIISGGPIQWGPTKVSVGIPGSSSFL